MKYCIIIISIIMFLAGCASGGNESDTKLVLDDSIVDKVELKTEQAEKSSIADEVGRDNNTTNADLSKGWGGMLAIKSLLMLMVGFILVLCPTMKNPKIRWLLIIAAASSFVAAIYLSAQFYG